MITRASRPTLPNRSPEIREVAKMSLIKSKADMEQAYYLLVGDMLDTPLFDRGEVHAQKTTAPEMVTRELNHITQYIWVPRSMKAWQIRVSPNLPWAEAHFRERVGGEPLNPSPEEANWPFAQQGNKVHKQDEKFSHTYPERFWPKHAGHNWGPKPEYFQPVEQHPDLCKKKGVRFDYGDLGDLVKILRKNPRSRQAYLPVWFPEDLTAAVEGQRVPCTLGYHIMMNRHGRMDMVYSMRSCDMIRFYRDDIYMAGRLLQWVCQQLGGLEPDKLTVHIDNLHTFEGDRMFLSNVMTQYEELYGAVWGAAV